MRAALTLVARGEAPLGIVYSTDAKVEPGVKIVGTFPDDSHDPIIYPVAATATAKPDVTPYLAFLRSAAAKAIFEKYGFIVLMKPTSSQRRSQPGLDLFDLSPAEWTAIELSLRIAIVATLVRAAVRHRASAGCWRAEISGASPCSTGWSICRWCCRRSSPAICCCISFGRRGLIGAFLADHLGIVFSFRWTGAALACGVMGFR